MIRTQLHYLILISLVGATVLHPMKRSADQISTVPSVHDPISSEIFQHLPRELIPTILAHTNLPKNMLLFLCKATYNYFCFRNHLTDKSAVQKPDNWEFLLPAHPRLIVNNEYDCQRLYYLLIKANNLGGMKQLLQADEHRETNLKQIVVVCFGLAALESRISPEMKTLIYEYCPSRNKSGRWCLDCGKWLKDYSTFRICACEQIPYTGIFGQVESIDRMMSELIDIIMTNNIASINEKLPNLLNLSIKLTEQFSAYSLIPSISKCVCYYGSQYMQESFYAFFKKSDPTDLYGTRKDAFNNAIKIKNYTKAEQLLSDGANPNSCGQMSRHMPLRIAIERAHEDGDYRLLKLLKKYHVKVNVAFSQDMCDFSFDPKNWRAQTISALSAHFGQTPLEDLIERRVSPLLYAVLLQNLKLVRALLDCGANPCAPQSCSPADGETLAERIPNTDLLEIAKALGNREIIDTIAAAQRSVILHKGRGSC